MNDSTAAVLLLMEKLKEQEQIMVEPLVGTGNTPTRGSYIFPFIEAALRVADPEHTFAISVYQPDCEVTLDTQMFDVVPKSGPQRRCPIARIVPVQDDFDWGKAQLYMSLRRTHKSNISKGFLSPLYGAVTNASVWIFVRYDGSSFENKAFLIQSLTEKDVIKAVVDLLCNIVATNLPQN